ADPGASVQKSDEGPSEFYSRDRKFKAILKKASNGFSTEFQVWDTVKDVRVIRGFNAARITAFAISDDRKLYAAAEEGGTIAVRSIEGSYTNFFQSSGSVTFLSFSEDGRWIQ